MRQPPQGPRIQNLGRHATALDATRSLSPATKNPISQTDDGGHQYAHPGLPLDQTGHWKANT